ncbi:MAG: citrate lyase subunit alpha [Sporomusaceae bacterium]|nr:citrate lyase subunit alpha [Sporomusaceae bacterium]
MKTVDGRELPDYIEGWGPVTAFQGVKWNQTLQGATRRLVSFSPKQQKLVESAEALLQKLQAKDGMTFSFHHHFRNGDYVVNTIMAAAQKMGLKNLKIALSSIFPCHEPLVALIKDGTITAIDTNYMNGPVAEAVSRGYLSTPVIMRSHGGRPRAIEEGSLKIDIAFIAAPLVDRFGNISGKDGLAACGSLGYAMVDAEYADTVVAVTDHLVETPLADFSIPMTQVDYILVLQEIGNPSGIVSGTTKITRDPVGLRIAALAADAIEAAGVLQPGFSFQTGAGGASLAVAHYLRQKMERLSLRGSFIMGGITGYLVDLLDAGLFERIYDVQCFDQRAIDSLKVNPHHREISASYYANPHTKGCVVNQLDCVVLGATEIDVHFNVNVTTGSNGMIMGGSGGHSDAAAGAGLTVIVANLLRSRLPIVRDQIMTVTTPGETVDLLVTEQGIAVNPRRPEIKAALLEKGLPVYSIEELKDLAEEIAGTPKEIATSDEVVALVEYRDGTIIDVVRKVIG